MATLDVTRAVRFRGALKIMLDDLAGQETFTIETPGGLKLELRDGVGEVRIGNANGPSMTFDKNAITVKAASGIQIADVNGNSVIFDAGGMTVNAAAKVKVNASMVEISAAAINVNAGMTKFSGVIQCDTLISNNVISASYTPGAGNIL